MEKEIRKLARSNYYQNLYNSSKECYGICIFDNSSNFSGLQLLFLYWLSTYAMLYQELATHEDECLTENVINNDLRCYDKETEILTDQGWKFFKDLNKHEKVATLNPDTDEIIYQLPICYIKYTYCGKMHYLKSDSFDFCVTPNHQNFIGKKTKKGFIGCLRSSLEIFGKCHLYFKKTGTFIGKNTKFFILPSITKIIKIPNRWHREIWIEKRIQEKKKYISMNLWIRFLGWYLSKGSCHITYKKNNKKPCAYKVSISQSKEKNYNKWLEIKNLLDELHFSYTCSDGKQFVISNKQLYEYLKQFGKCHEKYVPGFVKLLSKELIQLFLETYKKGDGCNQSKNVFSISTSSNKMKDDLMELGIKAGYGVSSYLSYKGGSEINNKYKINYDNFNIYFRKNISYVQSIKNSRIEKWIDYNNYVYCVEVPLYHTILIRRNGKTMWSGNCDAYLLHRKNKYDDFWKKHRREEQLNEIRQKHPTKHKSGNTTLISTKFYIEDKDNKNG